MTPIPYGRQWIDDDDVTAVVEVLRGDWLTQGPAVERFERALAERCGARHAVAVSNGTAALHLACLAAGLSHDDEGITSPLTFLASASCLISCGARPRFADIDARTWTLDPAEVERRISPRTKALIPVDYGGLPCDLDRLRALADQHDLTVIHDACHSLGATYRQRPIGGTGLAEMTCFSFHPVKVVTTGEGGAVATDDDRLARRLRRLRHHGVSRSREAAERFGGPWAYELRELGLNARITDLQCALGLSQLGKLDRFVARRRQIAARYREALAELPGLTVQGEPGDRSSAHHLFAVHLDPERYDRRAVFEALGQRGIRCQVHYVPVHLQPLLLQRYGTAEGDCPRAERFYRGALSLPLFPRLTDADVDRVIEATREVIGG